jgi:hypothetical protein
MLSAAIDAWLVTLSRPAKKIAAALFFNTIFTPSLLCLLSGLVFTRLSGASGPSGLAGDRAKGWFCVLARWAHLAGVVGLWNIILWYSKLSASILPYRLSVWPGFLQSLWERACSR